MEQKKFELPTHPTKGKQYVLLERPSKKSVWYLVVDSSKSIPLVNMKNPSSVKGVLDQVAKEKGKGWVTQFVMGGFSKLD